MISKIHYHPGDPQGELSEYIELLNISDQDVDLAGVAFTQGISFSFGDDTTLTPGQRVVLVADAAAFTSAFGDSATILGTYPSRLDNGGEQLTLRAADGSPMHAVRFDDQVPWPGEADGLGYSLVLVSPNSAPDHALPQNWRASLDSGGAPGGSDSVPFTGNPDTDLFSYALGDPNGVIIRMIDGLPVLELPRILGADDVSVRVEVSSDLETWQDSEAILLNQSARNGNSIITQWSLAPELEGQKYARVIVTQNQ